jgi:hypothetical protein
MRWREEVILVQEEMRRVLEFFAWYANWWKSKAQGWSESTEQMREGLIAYAERQASIRLSMHDHFERLWRFVPQYISLGVDAVDGEDDEGEEDEEEGDYDE